jgi:crotonobetainyl-CoA:carnitine CoA-transferase CaiB-like acyl-CoA transferase
MALTGRADGAALGPPSRLVAGLRLVGDRISEASAAIGHRVDVDALALLGERAALRGLQRQGSISCGGNTRLLPTADGWLAVCLSRADDVRALPAWLGLPDDPPDPWAAVATALARQPTEALAAQARLLGLPVAALGERSAATSTWSGLPAVARYHGQAPPTTDLTGVTVVDLSALWAGPLATSLLVMAGARVIKVESTSRPDAFRNGDPALFDLLNTAKDSVVLDLRTTTGTAALARLVAAADVVVEASRPRALEQLGIRASDLLTAGDGPWVWVSITGHGRAAPARDWVGFGDDAAVAGGLVVWDDRGPCFCADAVADPTTGLAAAAATLMALRNGGRWLLDVSLAGTAAWLAGPTQALPVWLLPAPPRARDVVDRAHPLGSDTDRVLSALE